MGAVPGRGHRLRAMLELAWTDPAAALLRWTATAAHASQATGPRPWMAALQLRATKAWLRASARRDSARIALWRSEHRHPEPGWAGRGLIALEADPALARSGAAHALALRLLADRASMSDPAQRADALRLAALRAGQLAGLDMAILGAGFVLDELGATNPEAAELFRVELTRLDPGWHRRGLPDDEAGKFAAREPGFVKSMKNTEGEQEAALEARALEDASAPKTPTPAAQAAPVRRRL